MRQSALAARFRALRDLMFATRCGAPSTQTPSTGTRLGETTARGRSTASRQPRRNGARSWRAGRITSASGRWPAPAGAGTGQTLRRWCRLVGDVDDAFHAELGVLAVVAEHVTSLA